MHLSAFWRFELFLVSSWKLEMKEHHLSRSNSVDSLKDGIRLAGRRQDSWSTVQIQTSSFQERSRPLISLAQLHELWRVLRAVCVTDGWWHNFCRATMYKFVLLAATVMMVIQGQLAVICLYHPRQVNPCLGIHSEWWWQAKRLH